MGRYIIDNPEPPTAMEQLRGNLGRVTNFYLQKKMGDIERKQKMADELDLLREKAKIEQESPMYKTEQRAKVLGVAAQMNQDPRSVASLIGYNPDELFHSASPSTSPSLSSYPMAGTPVFGNKDGNNTLTVNPSLDKQPNLVIKDYEQKMGMLQPKSIIDLNATAREKGGSSYSEAIGQSKGKEAVASSMIDQLNRNLSADLKSSLIESGGGGPIKGRIAKAVTFLGQAPSTFGLQNTKRDTAIAYARQLAGGSQGVQRLFEHVLSSLPDESASEEQMATALNQMNLTAKQLQAGMQRMGYTEEQMKGISDSELANIVAAGSSSINRGAVQNEFSKMLGETSPTNVMDMSGRMRAPTPNVIADKMNWRWNPSKQNPVFGNQGGNQAGDIQQTPSFGGQQSQQGNIRVISPDGRTGTIPANQLEEALKSGYKKYGD